MPILSIQSFLKISPNKRYLLKEEENKRRIKLTELSKRPEIICMSSWHNRRS